MSILLDNPEVSARLLTEESRGSAILDLGEPRVAWGRGYVKCNDVTVYSTQNIRQTLDFLTCLNHFTYVMIINISIVSNASIFSCSVYHSLESTWLLSDHIDRDDSRTKTSLFDETIEVLK